MERPLVVVMEMDDIGEVEVWDALSVPPLNEAAGAAALEARGVSGDAAEFLARYGTVRAGAAMLEVCVSNGGFNAPLGASTSGLTLKYLPMLLHAAGAGARVVLLSSADRAPEGAAVATRIRAALAAAEGGALTVLDVGPDNAREVAEQLRIP